MKNDRLTDGRNATLNTACRGGQYKNGTIAD